MPHPIVVLLLQSRLPNRTPTVREGTLWLQPSGIQSLMLSGVSTSGYRGPNP